MELTTGRGLLPGQKFGSPRATFRNGREEEEGWREGGDGRKVLMGRGLGAIAADYGVNRLERDTDPPWLNSLLPVSLSP